MGIRVDNFSTCASAWYITDTALESLRGERIDSVTYENQDVSLTLTGDEGMLFGTAKHIINEGTVQIFTTRTNKIKKGLVVLHIVFFIDQLFLLDGLVTERTEYHPPPHHCHGFSF
jgi:hypothetical protein